MSKLKPHTTFLLSHESFPFLFSLTSVAERISQSQFPQKETLNPNATPKPLSIQSQLLIAISYEKYKNLDHVKQVHAPLTTSGLLLSSDVANRLLYKYIRFYDLSNARLLFDRMPERDLTSWNVMICGSALHGDCFHCLSTFRELIKCGLRPDHITLPPVIKACRVSMGFHMGRLIHCLVMKNGFTSDHVVCGSFVDMYAKWMFMDAKKLFDEMPIKNLETWTIMIQAYAERGNVDELLFLYARMREEGFSPNEVVMMAVTKVYAKFGAMNEASLVHDYAKQNQNPKPTLPGHDGFIDNEVR